MLRKFLEGREKRREEQERQRLEEERTKWLTVPIERDFFSRNYPHPSFEELADRAIQQAEPNAEFDHDAVVAYVYNFWFARTIGIMRKKSQLSNAVDGLLMIPQRDDFEYRMLWDYLTMHGAVGTALHNILAEEMQSDSLIEAWASRISYGYLCDVDEASRLARDDVDLVYFSGK